MKSPVSCLALLVGVLLTLAACADSPTQSESSTREFAPGTTLQVDLVQGCVIGGVCVLPPRSPDWSCDPWEDLNWCEDDSCMTSVFEPADPTVQSCPGDGGGAPGGGTPPPPPDDGVICPLDEVTTTCPEPPAEECLDCIAPEEEDRDICPAPFLGNVAPALINIAGRNHEFRFSGPLTRLDGGRSPSRYQLTRPKSSEDAWWIAESGTIRLVCWGRWISRRYWLGKAFVQDSDLHMVMGPGHPDF